MQVKICGLRSRADMHAAAEAGASWGGLVFFPPSPRNISLADARFIVGSRPDGLKIVVLTVDAEDTLLNEIVEAVSPEMIQLSGDEDVDRVAEVRSRYGIPVMKAVGLAGADDLAALDAYSEVADHILVDARPSDAGALPGGNGIAFDWRLLQGRTWSVPWMLAGGLTPGNVGEAIRLTGAQAVDVSSGVEASRGVKDHTLIGRFVAAALAEVSAPV